LSDIALDQRRVVPRQLPQRRGDHVLRHRVHLLREADLIGHRRPRGREALVGDAPEQQRLCLERLVELELGALLAALELEGPAAALLLGGRTYEGFAQAWPERAGSGDFADRFNELPKYVASRTLPAGEAEWNATVLAGDTAEAVAAVKEQPGENLVKYGTGEF